MPQGTLPQTTNTTKQKQPKPSKPPKTLANLMEINKNGRGCPRRTLPQTQKTTKHKQQKQAQTQANLIKGNGRGWPKVPYHIPPKPVSKNSQNHQNHQHLANLMDINRNGRGCPRRTLPTTGEATKQKQPKQAKTLANLMVIKGNGREWPKVPYHKPQQTLSKNN